MKIGYLVALMLVTSGMSYLVRVCMREHKRNMQEEIMGILREESTTVGDGDQSIYEFRGTKRKVRNKKEGKT